MQIILSAKNGEQSLEIPVIPPEIKIDKGQKSETFTTAAGTEFALVSPAGVVAVSWSSFFPCRDYTFLKCTRLNHPNDYVYTIDTWQTQKLPVRLVISNDGKTIINIPVRCVINNYSIDPSGDYNYEIECDKIPSELIEEGLTTAQYEELKAEIENIKALLEPLTRRYNYFEEEGFPDFALEAGDALYSRGYLQGSGDGIDCTYDMLRLLTIGYRAQAFRDMDVYNWVDENMPEWARQYVQWLIDNGCLQGDGETGLDLTPDMLRLIVIFTKALMTQHSDIVLPDIDVSGGADDTDDDANTDDTGGLDD